MPSVDLIADQVYADRSNLTNHGVDKRKTRANNKWDAVNGSDIQLYKIATMGIKQS